MIRRVFIAGCTLSLLSACLEGDPNPLANGGSGPGTIGPAPSGSTTPMPVTPSGQCSQSSSEAITLTFRNRSPNVTVNVFWVDFSCNESRYATLAPGAEHVQPTFVSHPWRLRDAGTNALYKEFIPVRGGATQVEFP